MIEEQEIKETEANGSNFPWKTALIGLASGILATFIIAIIVLTVGMYKFNWGGKAVELVTKTLPYPAATVNSGVIRLSEYQDDVRTLEQFYDRAADYGFEDFGAKPTLQEIRTNALDRLILLASKPRSTPVVCKILLI